MTQFRTDALSIQNVARALRNKGRRALMWTRMLPLLVLAAVFALAAAAVADTIVLKNGRRIENVTTWEEDGMIRCVRFGAVVGYPAALVARVEKSVPAPTPESDEPEATATPAVPGPGRYKVIRVFDGDSFLATDGVIEFQIRIVGIDAPEGSNPKKDRPTQPFADAARDFLSARILNRTVRIQEYGTDQYRRQLAEVFAENENVGLSLVENGLAEAYRGKPAEGVNIRVYRDAERAARRNGKGVWSQGKSYVSPREWRKRHQ